MVAFFAPLAISTFFLSIDLLTLVTVHQCFPIVSPYHRPGVGILVFFDGQLRPLLGQISKVLLERLRFLCRQIDENEAFVGDVHMDREEAVLGLVKVGWKLWRLDQVPYSLLSACTTSTERLASQIIAPAMVATSQNAATGTFWLLDNRKSSVATGIMESLHCSKTGGPRARRGPTLYSPFLFKIMK
jgi:hypothetical protein